MGSADSRTTAALFELTDRQAECLKYIAEGMTSKEIGRALGIAPSTVDNHIHAAVVKLNAKNRWQAAQLLHRERTNRPVGSFDRRSVLPPIGGRRNSTRPRERLLQIVAIAAVALIVVAAVSSSIVAAVYVFSAM